MEKDDEKHQAEYGSRRTIRSGNVGEKVVDCENDYLIERYKTACPATVYRRWMTA